MGFTRKIGQLLILLSLVARLNGATVTNAGLSTTGDTSNVASYTSGSFTPAAGDLLVAFVAVSANTATPTMTDSQSLGFTLVTSATWAAAAGRIHCFVSNNTAAASSMTVTFACTGGATGANIQVARISGMSRKGSSAIKQSAIQSEVATASAAAPAFSASALTGNPTLGAVVNGVNPATLTPPSSWTEQADMGFSTPTCGMEYVSRDSGFTGTTITWGSNTGGSNPGGAIIIELDTSAPAVSATNGFFQW